MQMGGLVTKRNSETTINQPHPKTKVWTMKWYNCKENKGGDEVMGNRPTVKPGKAVTDSGIYKSTKTGTKSTLVKGESAPSTKGKGEAWKQVVDTNPKKK